MVMAAAIVEEGCGAVRAVIICTVEKGCQATREASNCGRDKGWLGAACQ